MNREQNTRALSILSKLETQGPDPYSSTQKAIELLRELVNAPDWLVTISWPGDPGRGIESYGLFTAAQADQFVTGCLDAARRGWPLLKGAQFLQHQINDPFDPTKLNP